MDWQEKIRLRQESNLKIIKILTDVVEKYPDWRFWQIMYNLGFETYPDRFYDESYDTLKHLEAVCKIEDSELTPT